MTDEQEERYGLLASFGSAEALRTAVQALRAERYVALEAYAPYPVEGLGEALGFRSRAVGLTALLAAVAVAIGTYFMQWYSAVLDYPFVQGGKPLHSWPAFIPATVALVLLAAVLGAMFAMLAGNRLPQPYHPAFNVEDFARASEDGFFLLVAASDPAYDDQVIRQRLQALNAVAIEAVPL